jgi:outer membrane protein TolC
MADERALSLVECIHLALEHNLDLQSGRRDPLIAAETLREAAAGYAPSIRLRAGYRSTTTDQGEALVESDHESYEAGLTGQMASGLTYFLGANRNGGQLSSSRDAMSEERGFVGGEVRQPLLKNRSIDSLRLKIELNEFNVLNSQAGLQDLLMNLVTDVEFAYYDLVAARDQLRIIQQANELAAELVKSHRKHVEVGRLARLDVKQAEAAVAASEASLLVASNRVTRRENTLKLLITDAFSDWVDTDIVPTSALRTNVIAVSRENSWARALTNRPDMIRAKLNLEQEDIQLRFAGNQVYPSLDLTASYGLSGSDQNISKGDTPEYGVGLVFSIPLGNEESRARLAARKHRKEQALISFKRLEQKVMAEVVNAMNDVESSAGRVTATAKARAFAETALEAEEKKLANGKSTNFIVLQLQNDLTQARLSETLAKVDYNRALATLALREASTLKKHSISLEPAEEEPAQEEPAEPKPDAP